MQLNKKSCFDYAFGVRAWQQVSSLKCIEQNWQFHTLFAFIRSMILSFFSFAHLGDGKTLGLLTNVTDHYHFRQITPALHMSAEPK